MEAERVKRADHMESDRLLVQTAELSRKPEPAQSGGRATNYRWLVVALLFFAITINYIDRAVLGVLKPLLDEKLGWDKQRVFAPKWTHEESSILTALIFTFEVVGLGPIWTEEGPKTGK